MYKIALNAGHGLNTAGKRCLASLAQMRAAAKAFIDKIYKEVQYWEIIT